MKNINLPGFSASLVFKNEPALYGSGYLMDHLVTVPVRLQTSRVMPSLDNQQGTGCGSECKSDNGQESCCCDVGMKCVKTCGWCGCKDATAVQIGSRPTLFSRARTFARL